MSKPYHIHEYEPPEGAGGGRRLPWLAAASAFGYWLWRRRRSSGESTEEAVDPEGLERGHRPEDDTSVRGVVAFAAGLVLLLLVLFGSIALLLSLFRQASPDESTADVPYAGYSVEPRRPQLQIDPSIELKEVRSREDSLLHSYAWSERERRSVRIPIERAMELFADSVTSERAADSVLLLTESGYVKVAAGFPPPSSPPYLGGSPEPYAVNAEIAEILGLIRTSEQEDTLEQQPEDTLEHRDAIEQEPDPSER